MATSAKPTAVPASSRSSRHAWSGEARMDSASSRSAATGLAGQERDGGRPRSRGRFRGRSGCHGYQLQNAMHMSAANRVYRPLDQRIRQFIDYSISVTLVLGALCASSMPRCTRLGKTNRISANAEAKSIALEASSDDGNEAA